MAGANRPWTRENTQREDVPFSNGASPAAGSKTAREVWQDRNFQLPQQSVVKLLTDIRELLMRTFKPPTVQYLAMPPIHIPGTIIPGLGGNVGLLALDHDDDRVTIHFFNNGAAGAANSVYIRPDDPNVPTTDFVFPIPGQTYFTLGIGNVCPSNRIFVAGTGAPDLFIMVIRVDRFPRSTR